MRNDVLDGLNVSRETIDRLRTYEKLVIKWSKTINLVSLGDLNKIWDRHILDCMQIYPHLPDRPASYLDFGSGGGFPAVVLSALLFENDPNIKIYLAESDGRKAAFLRTVFREIQIPGIVFTERVQQVDLPPADVISARAVAALSDLFSMAETLINKETVCFFPKGKTWKKEVEEAEKKWHFCCETVKSQTQSEAVILKLGSIERVRI